jgi:hypothetical protein
MTSETQILLREIERNESDSRHLRSRNDQVDLHSAAEVDPSVGSLRALPNVPSFVKI